MAAAGTAAPLDPVSAIAEAAGEGFKTIGAALGIFSNREQAYETNKNLRFGYAQMDNAQNAQRLGFLQSSQKQQQSLLFVVTGLMTVLVIAFAFLHKHK